MRAKLPISSTLLLVAACGSGQIAGSEIPDDRAGAEVGVRGGTATPAEGVTRVELVCDEGAAERCDALDDDCDGRIDEGCGYGEGVVSIVATWGDDSDVDLVLTSDGADDLGSPETHTGRGACGGDQEHPRIESAAWRAPPRGSVRVSLAHVDACRGAEDGEAEGGSAATTGSVSIAIDGETIGAFNVALTPGQTTPVAMLSPAD